MAIDRLIGSRCQQSSAIVTEVIVQIIIDRCDQACRTGKGGLHIVLVKDTILLVVHFVTTRCKRKHYNSEAYYILDFHILLVLDDFVIQAIRVLQKVQTLHCD